MSDLGKSLVKSLEGFTRLLKSGKAIESECRVTKFVIENGNVVSKRSGVKLEKKDGELSCRLPNQNLLQDHLLPLGRGQ